MVNQLYLCNEHCLTEKGKIVSTCSNRHQSQMQHVSERNHLQNTKDKIIETKTACQQLAVELRGSGGGC